MIGISGLRKVYGEGEGAVVALDRIDLSIRRGDIHGIIGMSGAGKSTLIRCINLLEKPTEGKIIIGGVDVTTLSDALLRTTRRAVGMVFQSFNLLMQRSVENNVRFPMELVGMDKKAAREKARALLDLVGLSDKLNAYPSQLSGGQKQRVAIARALAIDPKVLLCDEATSALDPMTTRAILDLLKDINQRLGITIVVITHEMEVIRQICERVSIIDNGRIVESGAVGSIYMLRQAEKHSGPHSRWFYESDKAGGGVMMDMGCHAIAWFLWMLKGATGKNVYGNFLTVMHDTDAEDHAITQIEFERDGKTVLCVGEDSWAKHGGMQDMIEVYGDKGVAYSDLFQGNSSQMYSLEGYDYASEKAGATTGWTFPVFEEAFNQGYPQELTHFIDCVRNGLTPVSDGEYGKRVLEIIHAAYTSAKEGRKVALPYASSAKKPVDNWR